MMPRPVIARAFARLLAPALLACALLAANGARAQPAALGAGQIQVLGLGVDLDTRPDLPGAQYTMTAVRDIPTRVMAVVGSPDAPAPLSSLPAGALVKAQISGPGIVDPVTLSALPGQLMELPIFRVAGDYHLFNVRLEVPDGTVILRRNPALDLVVVNVIDQLLVTQVTSRPLTQDEIVERGIVIDESSFTVVNFTIGLTLGSQHVVIDLPTVIPVPGNPALTAPEIPRMPQIQLPASTFDQINIPNFSLTGFSIVPPPELEEQNGIQLPPIQGIVLIPGNIAFLHNFFSVIVQTTNQAPQFSGLVVSNAKAAAALPAGDDNIPGSGDDPLRIAQTTQGTASELPLLDSGGQARIAPAGSASAEFLVEGLREGTHVIDFRISGDLFVPQLGQSFPVSGLAAGVVQVKNPTFNVTLAHPDVVREGEAYSIFATVTNTSAQPANLFQLRLNGRSLSGAQLAPGETGQRQLPTLAGGQAESFEFHLIARTTGQVTGTVFLADPSINGSFVLTTGVGDTGIPLSPDTLVLPSTVDYLPDDPDIVFAFVRMLGQAYSVATAPAGALPSEIGRIRKSFVFDRAVKLAQTGLHVRLGEGGLPAVQDLMLDLLGNDRTRLARLYPGDPDKVARLTSDWDAFDGLRRLANAGTSLTQTLAQALAKQGAGLSLTDLTGSMARNFVWRPAHLALAGASPDPGLQLRIVDRDLHGLGRLADEAAPRREIPFGDIFDLPAVQGVSRILMIGSPESDVYVLDFQSPGGGPLELSLTIPDGQGHLLHLAYPATDLPAGAYGRFDWRAGGANDFIFNVDVDTDGEPDLTLAPIDLTPVPDAPPGIIAAQQWMKGDKPSSRVSFATGDPLGRLFAVLFNEEVDAASAQIPANYSIPKHAPSQAVLQPDRRVVFVVMDKPAGPFVQRNVTVQNVQDLQAQPMAPQSTPLLPDPERGEGGVVSGRLISAEGAPLAGVEVKYIQPVLQITNIDANLADSQVSTYLTDANGRFQIDFALRDGYEADNPDIWLNLRGAGGTNNFKIEGADPDTHAAGRASARIAFDGQHLAVDAIVRGSGSLSGHLFTEDGHPLPGRPPSDHNPLYAFATNLSTGEKSFTFVDVNGLYSFPRSFVDEGGLEFDAPSLAVGNILVQVVDPATGTTGVGTANIPRSGAAATLDLIMSPANHFGRVSGRVLESDGETGAANVPVFISAPVVTGVSLAGQTVSRQAVGSTTTDAAGNFVFDQVPIGDLKLRALRHSTFEQTDGAAFLEIGQEAYVTLILPGTGGIVRGLVRDALGHPVPHAPVAGGPTLTEADDNGFFEIDNLPLGRFTITARDAFSRATGKQDVELINPGDTQEIVITLEPIGSISGTVFRADGITRIPNQRVQLWVEPGRGIISEAKTGPDGGFDFENFPVGQYTIRAIEADLGDGGMANATIRFAGDHVDADVFFRGLGEIKGRVVQSNGTPVVSDVLVTNKVWRIISDSGSGTPNYYLDYLNSLSQQSDELADLVGGALSSVGYTQSTNDFFFLLDQSTAISSNILGPGGEVTGQFDFKGPATGGPFTVAAFGPFLAPAIKEGEISRSVNPADRIVDVGDIVLEPAVGSVAGTVFMPDGVTPVGANVKVKLRSLDNSGEVPAIGGGVTQPVLPEIEVVTDADGHYAFPVALRGGAALSADTGAPPPAIAAHSAAEIFTDDFQTSAGQRLLNVRLYGEARGVVPKGDAVRIDIRLQDMAGVAVTVFESDGVTTAPFAQVTLRTASTLDAAEEPGFLNNVADANGRIEFFPVIEGGYSIEAKIPATSKRGSTSGSIPVNPPRGFIQPARVVLGAVTSPNGQVTMAQIFGTVAGTVFRADGIPLTNPAQVLVRSGGASLIGTTDASGNYSIDLVPGGFFTVDVYEPLTARRGTGAGAIVADGQTVNVPVTLVGLGTVGGRVLDFDGQVPIPGADVTLFPSGNFTDPLHARSDGTGGFFLPGVPIGGFMVKAVDNISGLTGETDSSMPADGAIVNADVMLEAAGAIAGTVYAPGVVLNAQGVPVDAEGQPLPDPPTVASANVTIVRGQSFSQTVQADANGRYHSGSALLLGTYSITARPPIGQDGATAQATVSFNGQTAAANLALRGQGSVAGFVLDSLGTDPVAAARVTLTSQSPFSAGPTTRFTNADGSFEFDAIPVGPFSLSVVTTIQNPQLGASAQGALAAHGDAIHFEDGDGEAAHNAIRLQPAGSIIGRVVLDNGTTPAASAVIELTATLATPIVQLADAQGQFAFEGLPLGAYSLKISDPAGNGVAKRQTQLTFNGQTIDLGTISTDSVRPAILSTTPAANASGASPTAPIQINFSEGIDPASVSADSIRVLAAGQPVAGAFAVLASPPRVAFTPNVSMGDLKSISVTVRADKLGFQNEVLTPGVRDLAGNSLAADFVFAFVTGDGTPPVLTSLTPLDGSVEQSAASVIRWEFSEPVDPASVASVSLTRNGATAAGALNASPILGGRVLVFTPAVNLDPDAAYIATLTGPIRDVAGNAMAQTQLATSFRTVDTLPPVIQSFALQGPNPSVGGTATVEAGFADPADVQAVEFYLNGVLAATDATAPFAHAFFMDPALGSQAVAGAIAIDAAGNRSPLSTFVINISSNQPPTAQIASPAAGTVSHGATVNVIVNATDDIGVAQISFSANNGAIAASARTINPPLTSTQALFQFVVPDTLAPGSLITLRAAAADSLGLSAPSPAIVLTVVDHLPPVVSIIAPAAGIFVDPGATIAVTVRGQDGGSVDQLGLDASGALVSQQTQDIAPAQTTAERSFNITVPAGALPTQSLTLTAKARDASGNIGSKIIVLKIADHIAPQTTLSLDGGGTQIEPGRPFVVNVNASDSVGVVSVTASAGALLNETRPIAPAATAVLQQFTINAPSSLALGSQVTVNASSSDAAGNAGAATPLILTVADLTPPQVDLLEPAAGASVGPGQSIQVRVSATDNLALAAIGFTASGAATDDQESAVDPAALSAERTFTLQVPANAASGQTILIAGKARDASGRESQTAARAISVADTVPPAIVSTTPPGGASGVDPLADIVVQFSEPIAPATVNAATFVLAGPGGPVAGAISFSDANARATFNPNATLDLQTTYTLSIATGATDAAGNHLATPFAIAFRTASPDIVGPKVVSIVPADSAADVSIATAITVAFDEPIDPASITLASFHILAGANPVAGAFSFLDGNRSVRFTPAEALPLATQITTQLSAAITDVAGNALTDSAGAPLAAPLALAFTTGNFGISSPIAGKEVVEKSTIVLQASGSPGLGIANVVFTVNGAALPAVSGPGFSTPFVVPAADQVAALTIHATARNAASTIVGEDEIVVPVVAGLRFETQLLGVAPGRSVQAKLILSSPAPADLAIALSAHDAAIVAPQISALIPAGQSQTVVSIDGLTTGSTAVLAASSRGTASAVVSVSQPVASRSYTALAPPFGATVEDALSAMTIFLPADSVSNVGVRLLDAPAGAPIPVAVQSNNPGVVDVNNAPLIGAGDRIANFSIQTGPAGSAVLALQVAERRYGLKIVIGAATVDAQLAVAAQPVGINIIPPLSAGRVFIPENQQQTVQINLRSTPAPSNVNSIVVSSDASVASVVGLPSVPAGAEFGTVVIAAGQAGHAILTFNTAGELRTLDVFVGAPPAGTLPPLLAEPVGVSVIPPVSAGRIFLPANTLEQISVPMLNAPAGADQPIIAVSDQPNVATAVGSPFVAAGQQTVALSIQTGDPGQAVITLSAPGALRELTVIVGPPPAGTVPALLASPVGVSIVPPASSGTVVLPAFSSNTVSVPVLVSAAAAPVDVVIQSDDASLASAPSPLTIPAGSQSLAIPITTGPAGVAHLNLRAANGVVRTLTVIVGTPPAGSIPPLVAEPVGATAMPQLSLGRLVLPPDSAVSVDLRLLTVPSASPVSVSASVESGAASISNVVPASTIAAGLQTAQFVFQTAAEGAARLRIVVGATSYDLDIDVVADLSAPARPALLAAPVGIATTGVAFSPEGAIIFLDPAQMQTKERSATEDWTLYE